MTERRTVTRPRRGSSAKEGIPAGVAKFFEEGGKPPWVVLLPPHHDLLWEHWREWSAEHPGAMPPAQYEWIAEPPPAMRHGVTYAEHIRRAREWARKAVF